MTLDSELRAVVREAYRRCCGYCGVCEHNVGGMLEIDHFRPLRHSGTNALDNLVYACTTCNRFKGDYWPAPDVPESLSLLHPGRDKSTHLLETVEGRLAGLTPRGWFHIERLHLNRPQLIALRQARQMERLLQSETARAQDINIQLRKRIRELEAELIELRNTIASLSTNPR